MRFEVLGPLVVRTEGGAVVPVPEPKVRALLANLLLHEGRPVPADVLIDDLWGDRLPGNPANTLQTKVSQLRRALEKAEPGARELVAYGPSGYVLRVPAESTDAGRFTALTALAYDTAEPPADSRTDSRTKVKWLSEALALWRGQAYADFRDEGFARAAVARLEEQRLTAQEIRAEIVLDLAGPGEQGTLADELADLVAEQPLRERLRGAYMRALYRAGRQTEALDTYRDLRERLADDLGIDPGAELTALHGAMLRQAPGLSTPTPSSPARPLTNLPAPVTALIGRSKAVARVRQLLSTTRLVTLTGPGGVGKTRLALEAAAGFTEDFTDGVWLAELAGTRTGVAETVAAALGVRDDVSVIRDEEPEGGHGAWGGARGGAWGAADSPSPLATVLAKALAPRRLLLVLDNCEHVLDEAAALLDQLLRHAPGLRVLATSQEPLAITGETLEAVAPLGEDEALELFAARAAATAPGFALTAENTADAALICRRLDGIPLAVELAATRVRALGVHALADRLHDRFRLLNQSRRDAPARQRTLRAMIDWSWELLTPDEQSVLRQLSVFSGGFTLQSAEAVCKAPGIPGGGMGVTLGLDGGTGAMPGPGGGAGVTFGSGGSTGAMPGPGGGAGVTFGSGGSTGAMPGPGGGAGATFGPGGSTGATPGPGGGAGAMLGPGGGTAATLGPGGGTIATPGPGGGTAETPGPALDVLDLITRLVDRSLLTTAPGTDDTHGIRYRMLESVTAYSLERLNEAGETKETRRRHAHHYTHLAEQAARQLRGPAQHHWLHRLDTETVNLRAALEWAAMDDGTAEDGPALGVSPSGGSAASSNLAAPGDAPPSHSARTNTAPGATPTARDDAFSGTAPIGDPSTSGVAGDGAVTGSAVTGSALTRSALTGGATTGSAPGGSTPSELSARHAAHDRPAPGAAATPLSLRLANSLTWYWFLRGRLGEAERSLGGSLDPCPNGSAAASARTARAAFALLTGDAPRDTAADDDADPRSRWLLAYASCGFRTPHEDATIDGILEEFRAADDRWGVAAALSVRATLALYRGDLPALRRDAEDSAARFAELGDRWGQLQASEQLGVLAEIAADYEAATRLHRDGMRDAEELRLWTDVSFRLSRLGRIALLTGDDAAATDFHARAARLAEQHSHRPAQQFAETGLAIGARRRGDLDTAEQHLLPWLAWNRRLGVDSGSALILAQLGYVAEQRGDAQRAEELHREGLTTARATGDDRAVALALEGLAGARSLAGDHTRTAELLGAAAALREAAGSPLPPAERADVDRAAHRSRTALAEDDYAAAFTHGHTSPPEGW
ncbi:winged helix-turn-helix domain-containing protein [Streptomyces sp. NBC_01381]|uniref:AfsR/SARP family transcriptional regulator n=1 Tax=Streptomyces sp. NBC_01381 TaxID=2903845 RepID=UPI00225365E8|nr:BTAD domain-containing putative transcriptional regulator [Streptomyces sp. NBC_01381]MCX4669397.1 winged helix-turn-helix domain-containing protein [Streptomyces sp. NBC_01381]